MSEATTTPTVPTPAPARPRRGGPNRNIVAWGDGNNGKTTFVMSLVADPTDPRWRYLAHIDGDQSDASVEGLYADDSIARHFPVDLDAQQFRQALLDLIPDVASGKCGAVLVEGLCPLLDFYVGKAMGENPREADAGGMTMAKLYTGPNNKIRTVHSAITELYQAAPRDSGFVMVTTFHAKNVAGMGAPPSWAPDISGGVWLEFWRMTPIVLELTRLGDGPPMIEWNDPQQKIRRIKNGAARQQAQARRDAGKPLATLPAFLDTIRGAEAHQRKTQIARETAARAPKPAPSVEAPSAAAGV
jgi:hypothetical protein